MSRLCYNQLTWKQDLISREYSLNKTKKQEIIKEYGLHEGDSGSTEVQVALLTSRINQLTGHMVANRHDYATQRGLLNLVMQRRRLLSYLSKEDVGRYHTLIKSLGLRK
jgi:small subunit ribosomal protein S15